MNFIGIKTEQTEFTEKKWEKPFCEDLKNLRGVSFGKMKSIVKKLDRFCDELLDENHLLSVENEIHLDLIDEIEDKFHEVGNVNIFLNNHLNENKLGVKAQEVVRQSLMAFFVGDDQEIKKIKDNLEEVDGRVDHICKLARKRVLGRHGALHLEMEKYGANTWNTNRESKEITKKDKLSTRNYLNQVVDIEEEEEDKRRSSRENLISDEKEVNIMESGSDQLMETDESDLEDELKESELLNRRKTGKEFSEKNPNLNLEKSSQENVDEIEKSNKNENTEGFCYMKSGSGLRQIISEDSKLTEKFKTTISDNKKEELIKQIKLDENKNTPKIKPFGASFDDESDGSDLDATLSEDQNQKKPEIPQLKFYQKNDTQEMDQDDSDSMDLDSDEESLDNCTQEVIDFTRKGKKISMISLAKRHTTSGFNLKIGNPTENQRRSALGFGSSMRMIQENHDLAKNYMTERPRLPRKEFEDIPLRKEIKQILGGSYARMGTGSNSTLRYNQNIRASHPPRTQSMGEEKRIQQLLRVEKRELERILDKVERIREEIKLVCVTGANLFSSIENGFSKLSGTVEKVYLSLCETSDKSIYEKYMLNELTVVPKEEVDKILENTSKNQNDKIIMQAQLKSTKKRFEVYEKKIKDYESKNHRLIFNNQQLKKQIESLSRKVTVLENKKQKEEELDRRCGEFEVKSLKLKLNQSELREKQLKEEQVKLENKNFNLLKRKDNLIQNLKNDLNMTTEEIQLLKTKIKEIATKPKYVIEEESDEVTDDQCSIQEDNESQEIVEKYEKKIKSKMEMIEAKDDEIRDLRKKIRNKDNEIENLSMQITELKMESETEQNKYMDEIKELDSKIENYEDSNNELKRCNIFLTKRVDELRQENEKLKAAGGGEESFLFSDPLINSYQNMSQDINPFEKNEMILINLNKTNNMKGAQMKQEKIEMLENEMIPTIEKNPEEDLFDYMSESEIVKCPQSDLYDKNSLLFNTCDKEQFADLNIQLEKNQIDNNTEMRKKSKTEFFGGPTLVSKGSIFGEGLEEEQIENRFKKSKSLITKKSLEKGKDK
jgi:hypothetical protein